jgi:hypothetical protein
MGDRMGSSPIDRTTDCPKTRYFSGFSACFSTFSIHFCENKFSNGNATAAVAP